MKALSSRVAVVTGASSGIGRASALALAQEGAQLVLAARQLPALEAVAQEIGAMGQKALVVPTNVTQPSDIARLVEAAIDRFGRIDIVVASAGVYYRGRIADISPELFERSLQINFMGTVRLIMAAMPHLLAQNSGHIVLVSSIDGKKGLPTDGPYVAAKFAVNGFGDVLRQELYGTNIRVTTVFPGRVNTPMINGIRLPRISAPIEPEAVSRAILDAIRYRRCEVIVPFRSRFLLYAHFLAPQLGDWVIRHFHLEGW